MKNQREKKEGVSIYVFWLLDISFQAADRQNLIPTEVENLLFMSRGVKISGICL